MYFWYKQNAGFIRYRVKQVINCKEGSMKRGIIIFLGLFLANTAMSQVPFLLPKYYQPLDSSVVAKNQQKKDFDYGVTLGTSFGSSAVFGNMSSSYIAPHFSFQATPRLKMHVGGIMMTNAYNVNSTSGSVLGMGQGGSSYGVSAAGEYKMSENFQIFGSGTYFKDESIMDSYVSEMGNRDFKSMSLGMHYKLGEHFHIGAQVNFMDGYNPYYSPYRQNSSIMPFNPYNRFVW